MTRKYTFTKQNLTRLIWSKELQVSDMVADGWELVNEEIIKSCE